MEMCGYDILAGQIIAYKKKDNPAIQEVYVNGFTTQEYHHPGKKFMSIRPLSPKLRTDLSYDLPLEDFWVIVAIRAEGVPPELMNCLNHRFTLERIISEHAPK